jgi:hypothetical protein
VLVAGIDASRSPLPRPPQLRSPRLVGIPAVQAAVPSAALITAITVPPSVTEAKERRKPVWKKRQRSQASPSSSKATTATPTASAIP